MIDFQPQDMQPQDRMARVIDGILLGAAMLSLTFGLATALWSLLA